MAIFIGFFSPIKKIRFNSFIFLIIFLVVILSCSHKKLFVFPEPIPDDRKPVSEPKNRDVNIARDVIEKQFFDQMEQSFDLSRQIRNIFGKPKQAYNINAFDEVENSSWFTNRNHVKEFTNDEIALGPNTRAEPDTSGIWMITQVKAEGVTPGFRIKDSQGEGYVIKFEPAGYAEMVSGAEVVSTKLFYAAGYNTPENYIVYFDPKILRIDSKVKYTDIMGRKRPFTDRDLKTILKRVEILPNGLIRAAASKLLTAKAFLGPFYYKGVRNDDANDVIPHQHRRELRGLKVIAAWLNHFDTKANNSLDVFIEEGYVKHYLIDFGSTLGSNGNEPQPSLIGNENAFDPHQIAINTITFGSFLSPWEKEMNIRYPSIGNFESESFHPQKYKFIIPNPAFELMTDRDGFWGAKIVMSFTDEQLKTAVAQGQYSDPEAEEYLLRTLIERRDKVGRYWFNRANPLDKFVLRKNIYGYEQLHFVDLAVDKKLEQAKDAQYRYLIIPQKRKLSEYQNIGNSTTIKIPSVSEVISKNEISNISKFQFEVTIQTKHGKNKWSKWIKVYLAPTESDSNLRIIGILRQE